MGIHQAMHTAVSGLSSNTDGMSVISNNIANANTRSFKSGRAEFEDMLVLTVNENSQIGRGSRLRNVATNFQQGALTTTGGLTDLAIQGDGFFCVRNENMEVKESNNIFFTRSGAFHFDKEGYIVDTDGGKMLGYAADAKGRLGTQLTPIQVSSSGVPPQPTSIMNLNVNLDVRTKPPLEKFNIARAQDSSNHSSTVTIYDNMGTAHQSTIYFSRIDDPERVRWEWHATVDGRELDGKPDLGEDGFPIPKEIASGEIEFDVAGKPIPMFRTKGGNPSSIDLMERSDAFDVKFGNGAQAQKLQFNFGGVEDERGVMSNQTSTCIAANSTTNFHGQDGYEAGYIKSLKIDLAGNMYGLYTNGLQRRLSSVALATFANNAGLEKVGRNAYVASPRAGEPRFGTAQSGQRGSIYSMTLEESNVDMAQQFVDMITTQRAFQANSKSVTTTDQMMEEILGLRR